MASSEEIEKAKEALDRPEYKYRTIRGMAKETRVNSDSVQDILDFEIDHVVRSGYYNQYGELLYANRDKFKRRSFIAKLSSALANSAD